MNIIWYIPVRELDRLPTAAAGCRPVRLQTNETPIRLADRQTTLHNRVTRSGEMIRSNRSGMPAGAAPNSRHAPRIERFRTMQSRTEKPLLKVTFPPFSVLRRALLFVQPSWQHPIAQPNASCIDPTGDSAATSAAAAS